MHTHNPIDDLLSVVALAADQSDKPWLHSVINNSDPSDIDSQHDQLIDLTLLIQCRDREGKRFPEKDLEVELYKSGVDISITLSWHNFPDRPILWHGKHSLWMDSVSGKKCNQPEEGLNLEALARRLRTLIVIGD